MAVLEQNTEYDDDICPCDNHIQYFWCHFKNQKLANRDISCREALRSFTDYERSIFLRFVWARTRLPTATLTFPQKFKIQVTL